jgi:methionyl-tRNA formyltransferase
LKIVFMGTPDFAVPSLRALAVRHSIECVFTQPDRAVGRGLAVKPSPVKVAATELGIPIRQPEKLTQAGEREVLTQIAPDAIVVVAYGQILRPDVLSLPSLGCVNIHSSLLPRWRGAAPIQHALLAGDTETGITTMFMAPRLDAGDILLQRAIAIEPRETASSLHDRLSQLGAELILETLERLETGRIRPIPQDEGQVSYASKLTKDMETLLPGMPAEQADRHVRALNPWPGVSIRLAQGDRLRIKAATLRGDLSGMQGKLYQRNGMLLLGFSSGSIELERVQPEGKRELDSASYLNGLAGKGISLPVEWT